MEGYDDVPWYKVMGSLAIFFGGVIAMASVGAFVETHVSRDVAVWLVFAMFLLFEVGIATYWPAKLLAGED